MKKELLISSTGTWRMNRKVFSNVLSNYFSVVSIALVQIGTIYFFTKFADLKIYGEWLLIFTVPGYLSIAEFGVSAIIGTRLMKSYFYGRTALYKQQIHAGLAVLGLNFAIILIVCAIYFVSGYDLTSIGSIDVHEERIIVCLLVFYVLFCWLSNFIESIYRSLDLFHVGVFYNSCIRLLEFVPSFYLLSSGFGIFHFALGLVLSRFFLFCVFILLVVPHLKEIKHFPRFKLRSRHVFCFYLRGGRLLTFPMSNALLIQGVSVFVGVWLGASALAVFNIIRTVSRLLVQSAAAVNKAFWPRMTKSVIDKEALSFNRYIFTSVGVASCMNIVFGFGIWIFQGYIFTYMGNSKLQIPQDVFLFLLVSSLMTSVWQSYWVGLMALDRAKQFGYTFFQLSGIWFSGLILYGMLYEITLQVVALYMVVFELAIVFVSYFNVRSEIRRVFG